MKPQLILLTSLTLAGMSFSWGQNTLVAEQAQVIGKISDGTPSLRESVVKPLLDYKIHWSQISYAIGAVLNATYGIGWRETMLAPISTNGLPLGLLDMKITAR